MAVMEAIELGDGTEWEDDRNRETDDREADLMRTHWFLGLEPHSPSMS